MKTKTDALMRDENKNGSDLPALYRQMEEGLRLAASIFEKIPMPTLDLACQRAGIRHNGDKPMEFIRDILHNAELMASADEYQAKYRDSIIADTWPTLALCDCRRARRKNGSRACTEPDYQTHTACPECGQPWSKFILYNANMEAPNA